MGTGSRLVEAAPHGCTTWLHRMAAPRGCTTGMDEEGGERRTAYAQRCSTPQPSSQARGSVGAGEAGTAVGPAQALSEPGSKISWGPHTRTVCIRASGNSIALWGESCAFVCGGFCTMERTHLQERPSRIWRGSANAIRGYMPRTRLILSLILGTKQVWC